MPLSLRLYNIPAEITQAKLTEELLSLNIPIANVYLNMKTETENAGFALVDFESYEHFLLFGSHFTKMRHDLYIYKPVSQ
jgi:hypothetical protein